MVCRTPSPKKQHPAEWLNPRRRDYAERMIRFIHWHGSRILLPDRYDDVRHECELDKFQCDVATDDLFALGLVDIVRAGEGYSIRLLGTDIDAAPSAPAPRFVTAGRGRL